MNTNNTILRLATPFTFFEGSVFEKYGTKTIRDCINLIANFALELRNFTDTQVKDLIEYSREAKEDRGSTYYAILGLIAAGKIKFADNENREYDISYLYKDWSSYFETDPANKLPACYELFFKAIFSNPALMAREDEIFDFAKSKLDSVNELRTFIFTYPWRQKNMYTLVDIVQKELNEYMVKQIALAIEQDRFTEHTSGVHNNSKFNILLTWINSAKTTNGIYHVGKAMLSTPFLFEKGDVENFVKNYIVTGKEARLAEYALSYYWLNGFTSDILKVLIPSDRAFEVVIPIVKTGKISIEATIKLIQDFANKKEDDAKIEMLRKFLEAVIAIPGSKIGRNDLVKIIKSICQIDNNMLESVRTISFLSQEELSQIESVVPAKVRYETLFKNAPKFDPSYSQ